MKIIDQLRHKKYAAIFVIYLRYLIGGAFIFASVSKIQGYRFTTGDGSSYPLDHPFHFFETIYRSGMYWKFLGWSQLLAALILMSQRFAALGAAMFFPIILNIYLITVSYHFSGTPLVTGLMLLASTFLILWEYKRFIPFFITNYTAYIPDRFDKIMNNSLWAITGIILFVFSVGYVLIFGRNPTMWMPGCIIIGLAAFIFDLVFSNKKPSNN